MTDSPTTSTNHEDRGDERRHPLVEVLGEHQDACVAQHLVMQLMDGLSDVSVAFVAGRLVEREEVSSMATRQSWSAAWQQVQHRAQSLEPAA